jgi:tRNA A64-2'-O-ribosylphosphate transferase
MHLLPTIAEHGGYVPCMIVNTSLTIHSLLIVDSTRSGKRMPDALTKTVPIWCAVINKAYLVRHGGLLVDAERKAWREHADLFCPPWISGSEWDEIHQRLDSWAKRLLVSSLSRFSV